MLSMATTTNLSHLMATLPSYLTLLFINLQNPQTLGSSTIFPSGCVCLGDTLIYECTVIGIGTTIWSGSAFDCPSMSNEIVLYQSDFLHQGLCNNGDIVARIFSVEGNNYTSQLNVTVTPYIAGKTIECAYENGTRTIIQRSVVIPTITGALSPPKKLVTHISIDCPSGELTLTWSPVAPDCPAIHYNILASNCGSCPTTTNHTTATCTDVPTDGSVCTLAVQTVVCRNITGNASDPINIIFDAMEPIGLTDNRHTCTTENLSIHNSATNIAYSVSIGILATALIVCVAVSITVITVIIKRSKSKIMVAFGQSNNTERTIHNEPMYEDVTGPFPSVSAINTQDNVAYSQTVISTTA